LDGGLICDRRGSDRCRWWLHRSPRRGAADQQKATYRHTPQCRRCTAGCAHTAPSSVFMVSPWLTSKPGQHRLCWFTPKRAEKWSCIQWLKVSEIESISLVTRTPRALEIEPRGLTNSVGLGHVLLKWAEYRVTGGPRQPARMPSLRRLTGRVLQVRRWGGYLA
jgi:hypothetical protein